MSLDIYLIDPDPQRPPEPPGILIRRDGRIVKISREEWDRDNPGHEPVVLTKNASYVFWANITHNLGGMAEAAGVYKPLWTPEESGFTKAEHLIEPLQRGLVALRADPDYFRRFDPPGGWGNYEGL